MTGHRSRLSLDAGKRRLGDREPPSECRLGLVPRHRGCLQTVVTRPSQESAKLVWEKINTEHQGLFRRSDDIKRAIEAEEIEPLLSLLEKFRREVTAHFRSEEGVMARYAYPFADAHKGLHDNLTETLEEALGRTWSTGSMRLFLKITRHLTEELQHCVADDDHLRAFLTED